ncbi:MULTISPECIES: DUF6689 family protein [Pseudoalteromonas]|uniref:Uncharacterized protein n=1 Tax=Pseudoalteromonas gelatinilytica TaxID=1703256 RepID=A0A3A3EK61_9GAMM|nr:MULTISPECIES: DUF6689 family protein [Pseudoalteromonas]MDI4654597.1 hypothetical protein [Pseudoalteromonas shioyasakiensis]NUJ40985.1 hypothetical protein [Pseudoalteromonas sp. 0303]RJF33624.1 hypothetical protein D4741_16870 [Pseudoalteromonas profundi]
MNQFKVLSIIAFALTLMFVSSMSRGSELVSIDIQGNTVEAVINLPANISADITLEFENAVGLTAENIGLSAEIIDITSLDIIQRLPNSNSVSLQTLFPMLITIEPDTNSGFSFSGVASVDIHTHNLEYTAGTPLRFFKAPLGGEFKDITTTIGAGSYRARGSTGRFSQFIIVADLRPATVVINTKFNDLQTALNTFSSQIDSVVYSTLLQDVADINQAIMMLDYSSASSKVSLFINNVKANRGQAIPDVWRSSRDVDNVMGELIAYANTLRFSLRLAN